MDPDVKHELDRITAKFETRFDQLEERIEAIEARIEAIVDEQTRLGRVEGRVSSKVGLGRMDRR